MEEKKKWIAPELVVLVRSHPEEAVLATCKDTVGALSPTASNAGCVNFAGFCGDCASIAAS